MSDAIDPDERLDEVLRALADRVRALRRGRDLTVTDLSFESGLSEARLRAVEVGRTTASLATLVALADTFEISVADLFGIPSRPTSSFGETDAEPPSRYVVPSEVIWGGELPPAPWVTAAVVADPEPVKPAPKPTPATATPRTAPTEKTWGGPLPPAPWLATGGGSDGGAEPDARPLAAPTEPLPALEPAAPTTTWMPTATVPAVLPPAAMERAPTTSAASRVQRYATIHGMSANSAYVFVSPGATIPAAPRTFSDLRTGPLAGRDFRSLQEFAVAAVVEGGHALHDVARVFRLPAWRLEQWLIETGHVPR